MRIPVLPPKKHQNGMSQDALNHKLSPPAPTTKKQNLSPTPGHTQQKATETPELSTQQKAQEDRTLNPQP